jgi:hypothetical protein
MMLEFWLWSGRKGEIPKFRETLIEGYANENNWDSTTEILSFTSAKRLVMLGWIRSRSDHPQLRRQLKKSVMKQCGISRSTFPRN